MDLPVELLTRPVFSQRDAQAVGVSERDLVAALRTGQVTRIRRGWFTAHDLQSPDDRHRVRALAELAQREGVVASHTTGALLHGLPVRSIGPRTVHLLWATHGIATRTRGGVVIHSLPAAIRVQGDEIPVALACMQAAMVDAVSGLMAADQAVRERRTTPDQLAAQLTLLKGLRGVARAAHVLSLVDGERESPGESELAYVCDSLGHDLRTQVRLAGLSGQVYRVDNLMRGAAVIVEYDGRLKYAGPNALFAEKQREDDLRAAGWEFVRVTATLLRRPADLDRQLRLAVSRAQRRTAA